MKRMYQKNVTMIVNELFSEVNFYSIILVN